MLRASAAGRPEDGRSPTVATQVTGADNSGITSFDPELPRLGGLVEGEGCRGSAQDQLRDLVEVSRADFLLVPDGLVAVG